MFDRAAAGYHWAIDHEAWTAAWEYAELAEQIHELQERLAA
jgi:hypothetical protein